MYTSCLTDTNMKTVENEQLKDLRSEMQSNVDRLDGYCLYLYVFSFNSKMVLFYFQMLLSIIIIIVSKIIYHTMYL